MRVSDLVALLDDERGEVAEHAVGLAAPPAVVHVMSLAGHDADYLGNTWVYTINNLETDF